MLSLLDRVLRRGRITRHLTQVQYSFNTQRDRLRNAVIHGEAPQNDCFYAMDGFLTRAIERTHSLTLVGMLGACVPNQQTLDALNEFNAFIKLLDIAENAAFKPMFTASLNNIFEILAIRHPLIDFTLGHADKIIRSAKSIESMA